MFKELNPITISSFQITNALQNMKIIWETSSLSMEQDCEDLLLLPRFYDLLVKERPFLRDFFTPGHITGSSFIVTEDLSQVLLTHHRKLNKWLQFGGHSDGNSNTLEVALMESEEESGLNQFRSLDWATLIQNSFKYDSCLPFDIDIHEIPAIGSEPAHLHFDLRFLLVANDKDAITISERESHAVRWFGISEARKLNEERSMQRPFSKLDYLRKIL